MKWAQWLNALIGVWFIISPWTLNYSSDSGALWLSIIGGAILLIVSVWAASSDSGTGRGAWQNWIALLMGVWFIIEGPIFGLASGALWTNLILGVIALILAILAMSGSKSGR